MTTNNATRSSWRNRTLTIKLWHIAAVLVILPIFVFWMMVVHQNDEIIALVRNEVVTDAAGNRLWYGRFANTDDIPYRDLAVTVNFLDRDNRVVGKVKGDTDELAAHASLDLQAPLPAAAVRLRIYSVQWRNDRTATMMGPFREPWEFGYLMADPPK